MAVKFKIRKGDPVMVGTGRDKVKKGSVLKMLPKESKTIGQGVNVAKRHTKQSAQTQGGILSKEMPIHVSNLAHVDPSDNKPTRVGFKVLDDGSRVRVAKRSGEVIDG